MTALVNTQKKGAKAPFFSPAAMQQKSPLGHSTLYDYER
jgi:hypothetical protein